MRSHRVSAGARFQCVQAGPFPNARSLDTWAHEPSAVDLIPLAFADSQTKSLLEDKPSFWRAISEDVKGRGPMPPIKVFKHGMQSLYSKTKGGVDGTAQARAIMRSSTSSLRWEQTLFIQTLKMLAVNAITSYRLQCKANLLELRDSFGSMKRCRDSLSSVQSLSDFTYDVSGELLQHADGLQVASAVHDKMNRHKGSINYADVSRLSSLAKSRKRRRLIFFNEQDGIKLRTGSTHKENQVPELLYCSLCSINSMNQASDVTEAASSHTTPSFRGQRSIQVQSLPRTPFWSHLPYP